MEGEKQHTMIGTQLLLEFAKDADKHELNRRVTPELLEKLDPKGIHVVAYQMWHRKYQGEEDEYRLMILSKLKDQVEPCEIWLDVTQDLYHRAENIGPTAEFFHGNRQEIDEQIVEFNEYAALQQQIEEHA